MFSVEQDKEIIKDGGFFCNACLVGKPAIEQSPDPRYCQGCYDFLLKEAELLGGNSRPGWIPKNTRKSIENYPEKVIKVARHANLNMSTSADQKIKVDIISPRDATRKRGPKPKSLPENFILDLAQQGLGSKAITSRLKKDQGVTVSYKTIQRLLACQRV